MKGKDLFLLAGGALLVYMLIPKEKAQAAYSPLGGVSVIPQLIPGPTEIIERLIPGATQLIPGPTQIIERLIPGATQLIPGPTQIIERLVAGPTEFITEQIFPDMSEFDLEAWLRRTFGVGESGDQEDVKYSGDDPTVWQPWPDVVVKTPGLEIIPPEITIGGEGIAEATGGFLGSIINFPVNVINYALEEAHWPWRIDTGGNRPEPKPTAQLTQYARDVFIEAGITSAEFGAMPTAEREAFFAKDEVDAASKYPEYEADMRLLAETSPFLLSEAELERYS